MNELSLYESCMTRERDNHANPVNQLPISLHLLNRRCSTTEGTTTGASLISTWGPAVVLWFCWTPQSSLFGWRFQRQSPRAVSWSGICVKYDPRFPVHSTSLFLLLLGGDYVARSASKLQPTGVKCHFLSSNVP